MAKRDRDGSPSRPTKKAQTGRTLTKRPKGGAEIRDAVITAAERLFRDRSPASVTLREIAAEAGVQQSLVYRYFRTKENLLASVFYPQVRLIQTAFVEAPDGVAALRELGYAHQAPGYARSLAWAVLEGADLEMLFTEPEGAIGDGERVPARSIPTAKPTSEAEIDQRIMVASYLVLAMGWDLYEPYLLRVTGMEDIDRKVLTDRLVRLAGDLLSLGERGQDPT